MTGGTASSMLFCMNLPIVVDDFAAPDRDATNYPASVLFEKYAHGREEDFLKSYPTRVGLRDRKRGSIFAKESSAAKGGLPPCISTPAQRFLLDPFNGFGGN